MFTTKLPVEMIETAYTIGSYGTISVECEVQQGALGKGSWGVLYFLVCFAWLSLHHSFKLAVSWCHRRGLCPTESPGQCQVAASWSNCKHQATYVHWGWLFFLKISSTEIFIQVSGSMHMCSLKFKDIPTRLCQTWISATWEDDEYQKSGKFLLRNQSE